MELLFKKSTAFYNANLITKLVALLCYQKHNTITRNKKNIGQERTLRIRKNNEAFHIQSHTSGIFNDIKEERRKKSTSL